MSSEEQELRKKLDEYCTSRVRCKGCIFNDAVSGGCLDSSIFTADLKRLEALNRFKKEILGEGKKTITLEFELLKDGYRLISDISAINGITFSASDLTRINKAIETQEKLEYIFYRERNKIDLKEMVKKEKEND
jgi:hypothetical protein